MPSRHSMFVNCLGFLLVMWLALPPNARAQCPLSFAAFSLYATGNEARSTAVADFNGDGKPDLGVINRISGTFSVLLNHGDGTFASAVNYNVGATPRDIAAGDVNNDAIMDILVANSGSNNVGVFLGNGDGTFTANGTYSVSGTPRAIVIADFNDDGNLDVATAGFLNDMASIILGNGDGTFGSAVNYPVAGDPETIAAGDFNGDGVPDLAVGSSNTGNVSVLINNGTGIFAAAVNYSIGVLPSTANGVAVGDVNGDGTADIIVANFSFGFISVLSGNGDGTFNSAATVGQVFQPRRVAIDDLNGDSKPDLAIAGSTLSIQLGDGGGGFQLPVTTPPGVTPLSAAIADFNLDGRNDIAVAGGNSVSVLLNSNSSIAFSSQLEGRIVSEGQDVTLTAPATGDGPLSYRWLRDGVPVMNGPRISGATTDTLEITGVKSVDAGGYALKVTVTSGCEAWRTVTSNPAALCVTAIAPSCATSFAAAVNYTAANFPSGVAVGDLNGDGLSDVASANFGSHNASILLGASDGTFAAAVNYPVGNNPIATAIADLDGDSDNDLVVVNRNSNSVSVLLNNGGGNLAAAVNYSLGISPRSVAVGDLNGDTIADLVVAIEGTSSVSVLFGNGDGTFQAAVSHAAGSSTRAAVIGDLNADGVLDIAAVNFSSNNVSVLLGIGGGAFASAAHYPAGSGPQALTIGDVNSDGRLDLITGNTTSNDVAVLLGNGDGTFRSAIKSATGIPQSVALGDVNGDGRPDLAATSLGGAGNTLSLLLGNGDGTFQPLLSYGVGNGPVSVAMDDFNGDGRTDMVVANGNVNTVSVLLNESPATGFSAQPVSQSVAAGVNVVFTAGVSGDGPVSYHWRRNGLALSNSGPFSGANTPTLTITGATPAEAGAYDLQVSGGCNPGRLITSHPAALAVGVCRGDFNDDLVFDGLDIAEIVDALLANETCP